MKPKTILCLDVGNTRLKWGVCQLENLSFQQQGVISNVTGFGSDDLSTEFSGLDSLPVWISSVSSEQIIQLLSDWFLENWGIRVNCISADCNLYASLNGYKKPMDLGVDRWLAMVAAKQCASSAYCVVDAGTAITIDVVNAEKHVGGVIMPGREIMLNALRVNTANISSKEGRVVALADNTADGVTSGVNMCIEGAVNEALRRIRCEYSNLLIILTGGDASLIEAGCDFEVLVKKDLVLQGIGLIAREMYA